MSRTSDDDESSLILAVGSHRPQGSSLNEVVDALRAQSAQIPNERTLRRRLQALADNGRIRIVGRTRNRRYFAPELPSSKAQIPAEGTERNIPLSTAGAHVQTLIHLPFTARRPVGYNAGLLDNYVPGKTWYLDEHTRNHLHQLGRTPGDARPAGTFARAIYERLLIDLAWASSKLEGNTYSRLDTQNLLDNGIRAEGKDRLDATMLLNHKQAIALLVEQAELIGFNRYTIFNLHAALSAGLLANPREEGRLREKVVNITGTTFVPISIQQQIEKHFDVILAKANDIPDPFEQSLFMMVHLPYLQPFADVNKRTSRLAANISLVKANLCPLSFIDVPEQSYVDGTLAVYELNRVELLRDVYVWAYERSCEQYVVVRDSVAQPDPVRLRFRLELDEVVREMVVNGKPPVRSTIQRWASEHDIPTAYREAFTELAFGLLVDLHEGATYRYGIRPEEFVKWKAALMERRVRSEEDEVYPVPKLPR